MLAMQSGGFQKSGAPIQTQNSRALIYKDTQQMTPTFTETAMLLMQYSLELDGTTVQSIRLTCAGGIKAA